MKVRAQKRNSLAKVFVRMQGGTAGAEESSERSLTLDNYQRKDETMTKIKAVEEYKMHHMDKK